MQNESSSEEETIEEVSIIPESPVIDNFLTQNVFCSSPNSETPKRLKRRRSCKQSISSPSTSSFETPNVSTPKIHIQTRKSYWKSLASEFDPLPPAPPYIEKKTHVPVLSPEDYFRKYVPNDIIKMLTEFTNCRYLKDTGKNLYLTEEEMKHFFAITIIMSYLKFPRIRMYWTEKTRVPVIADNMSRNRYFLIRNNLKLRDDSIVEDEEKAKDKFWKVRPLLQTVLTGCLLNEKSSNVAVDEQIVPFFGHAPARQFIRGKPNPCGLKVFVATAPDGLPLDFFIYQGSGDKIISNSADDDLKELDTGGKVVLRLAENLPPGCNLYMDRYFTSIHLLDILHYKANCQGTGTLRKNNIPYNINFKTDSEMKRQGRGSVDEKVRSDGQVCVVKWYDNKPVVLASSAQGKHPEDTCKRWSKKDKEYIFINRPSIVKNYNSYMGGVDLLDRIISYYRICARTKKWTIRVIMHFIDFAIAASWIEYRRHKAMSSEPKIDLLDYLEFRVKIQEYLFHGSEECETSEYEPSEPPTPKKRKNNAKVPLPCDHLRKKKNLHLPEIPKPASKNRCRMPGCKSNSARIRCTTCKIFLCMQEDRQCFKLYHEF